jgi:hypothetical protein
VLHFAFSFSSVAGAMPNSACRSLSTTVLMSSSHRLLIICSPQTANFFKVTNVEKQNFLSDSSGSPILYSTCSQALLLVIVTHELQIWIISAFFCS